MNSNQSIYIIASEEDGWHYNARTREFYDLDNNYNIQNIREICYDADDKKFYLLVNKFNGSLGQYLIKFNEKDPSQYEFVLKVKNGLQIGNADIQIC